MGYKYSHLLTDLFPCLLTVARADHGVVCVVEVEYSVVDGDSKATAVHSVSVLQAVNALVSPVVFVGKPATYADEPMHFVFVAARHRLDMKYEVDYGDGTPAATFDASGSVSPIPDWAGASVAGAFGKDIRECSGAVLAHVYTTVGAYTARVRVTAAEQLDGGRYDELVLTTAVNATVRRRTLAQVGDAAVFFFCRRGIPRGAFRGITVKHDGSWFTSMLSPARGVSLRRHA